MFLVIVGYYGVLGCHLCDADSSSTQILTLLHQSSVGGSLFHRKMKNWGSRAEKNECVIQLDIDSILIDQSWKLNLYCDLRINFNFDMSKLRYLLLIAVLLVAAWSKAITTTSPTLQIDSLLHQSDYVRNALGKETYISLVAASGVSLAQKPDVKKVVKQVTRSIFNKVDHKGKKVLTYYGLMFAGAMARTAAATAVHPLNVCKTMLQTKGGVLPALTWSALSRGAGSQFIMSIPHGAINFAVTEVRI